jgi:hypothetical protein
MEIINEIKCKMVEWSRSFLLFLLGFLLRLVFLLDSLQLIKVTHSLDQAQVEFQTLGQHVFINGLRNLVLLFKVFDILVGVSVFIFSITIDLNIPEEVEE